MEQDESAKAEKKSWFARHKILTCVLIFFGLAVISSAMGGGDKTKQQASSPSGTVASQTTKEPAKSEPARTKVYQQVATFSGNGAKKSEPFTITGDRFKVKYDCKGDLCQAFLYSTSSEVVKEVLMNATGAVKDETIVYGPGEYYIQANTVGTYTMAVEDYK